MDGQVDVGSRHSYLVKEALKLSKAGVPMTKAMDLLAETNRDICNPPLERDELGHILAWSFGLEKPSAAPAAAAPVIHPKLVSPGIQDWDSYFTPVEQYLSEDEPMEMDWIVKDFLPRTYLVVLGGTSKAGKSVFVSSMVHAITQGEPFLGMETLKGGVLWCCFEESKVERRMVLELYGGAEAHPNLHISHNLPPLDRPEGAQVLKGAIEHFRPSLVVVDPLYGANSQESLSGGTAGRNSLAPLKRICEETNVAALVIHHFTKNVGAGLTRERMADSGQILAAASMDILMEATEQEDGSRIIRLKGKGRGPFATFDWKILSRSPTHFEMLEARNGHTPYRSTDDRILELLEADISELKSVEIQERLGLPLQTVRNALTSLKSRGLVTCKRISKEFFYTVPAPVP